MSAPNIRPGTFRGSRVVTAVLALWAAVQAGLAADFAVSTPNGQFSYVINGTSGNPTITLVRGNTYTFALSTSGSHPFAIGTSLGGPAPAGVSGNNNSSTGTITFTVPANAADCVYYCSVHFFSGNIHMIDKVAPPAVKLVGLKVGTNVMLTATQSTTNGFKFIPQANTNLATTNWFALTVQTNHFANGTNEILCGKPLGNPVFFRILIQ